MNNAERKLFVDCEVALLAWLRLYAPEQFNPTDVTESMKIMNDGGGWHAYTTALLARIRKEMAK